MVAPSFVIVTSPMSSTSILSKPSGPSELFTMLAIELTAITAKRKINQNKYCLIVSPMAIHRTHIRLSIAHWLILTSICTRSIERSNKSSQLERVNHDRNNKSSFKLPNFSHMMNSNRRQFISGYAKFTACNQTNDGMTNKNALQQSHTPLHSCRFIAIYRYFTYHFVYELVRPMFVYRQLIKHLQLSTFFTNIFSNAIESNEKMRIQRFEQCSKIYYAHKLAPCMKLNHVLFCCSRTNSDKCNDTTLAAMGIAFHLSNLHSMGGNAKDI